jgi:low affinity Fe/Cu permease
VIAVWILTGPIFGFSDTWQLVINTGTTIITFLMVFLIQSTQNRDAEALQVKLDEIIRAIGHAKNELLDLEELEEEDLDEIRETYIAIAREAREKRDTSRAGSGTPRGQRTQGKSQSRRTPRSREAPSERPRDARASALSAGGFTRHPPPPRGYFSRVQKRYAGTPARMMISPGHVVAV